MDSTASIRSMSQPGPIAAPMRYPLRDSVLEGPISVTHRVRMPGSALSVRECCAGEELAAIQLIHDHEHVVLGAHLGQRGQRRPGQHRTGGVVRVGQAQHVCVRGPQRGTQCPDVEHGLREAAEQVQADRDRLPAQEADDAPVGEVVRLDDADRVALLDQRGQREEQGALGTGRDDELVLRIDGRAGQRRQPPGQPLAHPGVTPVLGVSGLPAFTQGGHEGRLGRGMRREGVDVPVGEVHSDRVGGQVSRPGGQSPLARG